MPAVEHEYFIPISHIDYHILTALAGRDLYGYALIQECQVDSEGILNISPGSFYPALARLRRFGYIQAIRQDAPAGSPHSRQIFALTTTGRLILQQETARLRHITNLAHQRLQQQAPDTLSS